MQSVAELIFGKEPEQDGSEDIKPIAGLRSSLRGGTKTQEQTLVMPIRLRKGFQRKLESSEALRAERMRRIMEQYMPTNSSYTPMKGAGSIKKAMDFFGNRYGKHIAAGIVGNLIVESGGFDPNVISGKRRGDQGKAFGVAQWRSDRQANFQKAFGRSIQGSSLDDQLRFIEWELNNTEKSAKKKLLSAKTAEEAAELFDQHYERSSGEHRQRRKREAKQLFAM